MSKAHGIYLLRRSNAPHAGPREPEENASVSVLKRTRACLECGTEYVVNPRHMRGHKFCRPRCRAANRRSRLECGPRKRDRSHERLRKACLRILGRLQQGPATTLELFHAGGGMRASARCWELKQAGHDVRVIQHNRETGVVLWGLFVDGELAECGLPAASSQSQPSSRLDRG